MEGPRRVQPEGLARSSTASTACALQCSRPTNGCDLQAEHAGARVVAVLLTEAGVDHVLRGHANRVDLDSSIGTLA